MDRKYLPHISAHCLEENTVTKINCGVCDDQEDEVEEDAETAAKIFYKRGWRETETDIICPNCEPLTNVKERNK